MKGYYDLHIHSALSPCGDEDMTPNNIVNMALLKGLDIIAVTDHNSCGNLRAVTEVAGDRLLVVPGMEIESSEEVHILGYFPTIEAAEKMEELIRRNSTPVKNRPGIFGRQLYFNAEDEIVGEEERLLVMASGLTAKEVFHFVRELARWLKVPSPLGVQLDSLADDITFGLAPAMILFCYLKPIIGWWAL
ncbi:MAG: PHP domain-containing protein, partial [Clostridia bacterium]|nr:PHP domain-containing protein [Clostridia bacterium]